jgi:hypothetical protein
MVAPVRAIDQQLSVPIAPRAEHCLAALNHHPQKLRLVAATQPANSLLTALELASIDQSWLASDSWSLILRLAAA